MDHVTIFGCGYVGRVLARRLLARGLRVLGTTTSDVNLASLAQIGVEPILIDRDDPRTWAPALRGARSVIHLAPPDDRGPIQAQAEAFASACLSGPGGKAASPSRGGGPELVVYGSTTAAFGQANDPHDWIDETTISAGLSERGARRLAYEETLRSSGLPLRVVRIAGIYGPGRTLRSAIERDALILFEGAPYTSRIHVHDLARLFEAMLSPGAPDLAVACDDAPASTVDVAKYTYDLLGLRAPDVISLADAKRLLSKRALEMRLEGRRCRSVVRERLMGALSYPSYREGVLASLEAEGVATSRSAQIA